MQKLVWSATEKKKKMDNSSKKPERKNKGQTQIRKNLPPIRPETRCDIGLFRQYARDQLMKEGTLSVIRGGLRIRVGATLGRRGR